MSRATGHAAVTLAAFGGAAVGASCDHLDKPLAVAFFIAGVVCNTVAARLVLVR